MRFKKSIREEGNVTNKIISTRVKHFSLPSFQKIESFSRELGDMFNAI